MAKEKGDRRATDTWNNLKKLFEEYRAAKSDHSVKHEAARAAAARALELRLRIDVFIEANRLDVYRTVYAIEEKKGGRPILRRLVSGKNLGPDALRLTHIDFTGKSNNEACLEGIQEAVQRMQDSGEIGPGMEIQCECSPAQGDMNGQTVTMAVVDCVAGYPA